MDPRRAAAARRGVHAAAGDAEGMAELAARLDRFAWAAHTAQMAVAWHSQTVTAGNAGSAVDAFGGHAADLVKGLAGLTDWSEALAAYCRRMATEIRAAKSRFFVAVDILAGVLVAAQAMALITLGGSEEAALAETETAAFALRRMLAEAIGVGVVGGAVIGGSQAAAVGAADAGMASTVAAALTKNSLGRIAVGAAGGFVVNTGTDAAMNDGKVNWADDAATSLGMAGYGAAFHRVAQRVEVNSPEMTEQFAQSPVFRKSAVVQVTIAAGGEKVNTRLTNAGDGIVTNPGGEQYIIRESNLNKRYDHVAGDTYQAKGMVRAFQNPGMRPVMITAPWGEKMRGEPNAWFANVYDPGNPGVLGPDRYIIGAQEFIDTYGPYEPPAG